MKKEMKALITKANDAATAMSNALELFQEAIDDITGEVMANSEEKEIYCIDGLEGYWWVTLVDEKGLLQMFNGEEYCQVKPHQLICLDDSRNPLP